MEGNRERWEDEKNRAQLRKQMWQRVRQISDGVSSHDWRFKGFWSSLKESGVYGYNSTLSRSFLIVSFEILLYPTVDTDRKYGGMREN